MFDGLRSTASRLFATVNRALFRKHPTAGHLPGLPPAPSFQRLRNVVLADEVSRTLFQEYADHRAGLRGEEEIGWVLLGIREADHAVVMATLPAGGQRSAGVAHVQFDSTAQAVASRIVRQSDKRLRMLGVVHTHPGSFRQPSSGDFQGDSQWVGQLRGGEGIFGIGTADGIANDGRAQPHMQAQGELLMSWYALGAADRQYRPLEVLLAPGADLALPIHGIWKTIEEFAQPLERLCLQQAGVSFEIVPGRHGPALAVQLKLAQPGAALRIVLEGGAADYYWQREQEFFAVEAPDAPLDRGVYLVLAELAGQS